MHGVPGQVLFSPIICLVKLYAIILFCTWYHYVLYVSISYVKYNNLIRTCSVISIIYLFYVNIFFPLIIFSIRADFFYPQITNIFVKSLESRSKMLELLKIVFMLEVSWSLIWSASIFWTNPLSWLWKVQPFFLFARFCNICFVLLIWFGKFVYISWSDISYIVN